MRSILFKAKKLSDGKWVKGSLVKTPFGTFIKWYEDSICNKREVDTDTVCQSTGLTDCEGKEIWEGDLLTYRYFKDIYEVVWEEDYACFKIVNTRYRERTEPLGCSIRNIAWCVVGNKFDKEK